MGREEKVTQLKQMIQLEEIYQKVLAKERRLKHTETGSNNTDKIGWFGLVSLFNGISTFVAYLIPKPFS